MDVRQLITELLDCDLEADVSVEIETDEGSIDEEDFYIDETSLGHREFVSLKYESRDMVLIEKGELQSLKERIGELEDEINE